MEFGFVVLDRDLRVRGVGPAHSGLPWTAGLLVGSELAELATASVDEELIDASQRVIRDGSMHERTLRPRGHGEVLRRAQAIRGSRQAIEGVLVTWSSADASDKAVVDLQFLSVLTHDLRTPLGALTLWTRLLSNEGNETEQVNEAAEMIHRSVEELRDQIDDLGDIARLLAGRASLVEREFALRPLLFGAIEAQRVAATDADVMLTAELDPALGVVKADPARIQQVLTNLLANAIRFTPPNGSVAVTVRRDGADVEITVTDTGAGIPPGMLPVIFDRHATRRSASGETRRGLGLGLPVVQEIVDLHGGRVVAESAGAGQGATFRVRLPLPPVAASLGRSVATKAGAVLAGKTVLVIGAGTRVSDELSEALRTKGARVELARHEGAAQQVITTQHVEACVVEIGPPEFDAVEFLRDLQKSAGERAIGLRRRLSAVALGFPPAGATARRALQAGFAVCLPRDASRETVIAALDLALQA